MEHYRPYSEVLNRQADFRVKYRFYAADEGGRHCLPYQGIRSDFWYAHPDHKKGMLFMIWPEFENEKGEIILETDMPVKEQGTARMWIINDEFIEYHKDKIKIGTRGYFKEGAKSTGECEVIELLSIR